MYLNPDYWSIGKLVSRGFGTMNKFDISENEKGKAKF